MTRNLTEFLRISYKWNCWLSRPDKRLSKPVWKMYPKSEHIAKRSMARGLTSFIRQGFKEKMSQNRGKERGFNTSCGEWIE
jgi:hypothetical protein